MEIKNVEKKTANENSISARTNGNSRESIREHHKAPLKIELTLKKQI